MPDPSIDPLLDEVEHVIREVIAENETLHAALATVIDENEALRASQAKVSAQLMAALHKLRMARKAQQPPPRDWEDFDGG